SCGEYTPEREKEILTNIEAYTAPIASIRAESSTATPISIQTIDIVSDDPEGAFSVKAPQIFTYQNGAIARVVASPSATYFQAPYDCVVRITTNGGSRVLNLGRVPALTPQVTNRLRTNLENMIGKCFLWVTDFHDLRKPVKMRWLVDPPPFEFVGRRVWVLRAEGLDPHERLTMSGTDESTLMEARADEHGTARIASIFYDPKQAQTVTLSREPADET